MQQNYRHVGPAPFPAPQDRWVNMMPYVMGRLSSLPAHLHDLAPLLAACPLPAEELGRVGYLTLDERYVAAGSHRRAGLHTEGHGATDWGGGAWGRGAPAAGAWGGGWGGGAGQGAGLYVANTVPGSCALYDACVRATGPGGQVAPAQVAGAERVVLDANQLYWMHDRTPHESLPVPGHYRQFFRLVTSAVDVWYAQHSTPNPTGVQPAALVLQGSKFA